MNNTHCLDACCIIINLFKCVVMAPQLSFLGSLIWEESFDIVHDFTQVVSRISAQIDSAVLQKEICLKFHYDIMITIRLIRKKYCFYFVLMYVLRDQIILRSHWQ